MFNNPLMSDILFTCEESDKKFNAHKYVLATSSSVFYTMFYGFCGARLSTTFASLQLVICQEYSLILSRVAIF